MCNLNECVEEINNFFAYYKSVDLCKGIVVYKDKLNYEAEPGYTYEDKP